MEPGANDIADASLAADCARGSLLTFFEQSPTACGLLDRDLRFVRVNAAMARENHRTAEEHVGRKVSEVLPPALWADVAPLLERVLAGETIIERDFAGPSPADPTETKHWLTSFHPARENGEIVGICVIVHDAADRSSVADALYVRNRLYAMLSGVNRAVYKCRSRQELFDEICRVAVEAGQFKFAWVGVPDGSKVKVAARAGADAGYLDSIVVSLDPRDPRSHGPTGQAFLTGREMVIHDFMATEAMAPWHEQGRRVGIGSSCAFPFEERGKVVAALMMYAPTAGFFTNELTSMLSEVMQSVSLALNGFVTEEERRRDERDLRLLDRALRAATQGIVIADAQQDDVPLIYVSPGFTRLTGYEAPEVLGRNCRLLRGPDTDPATTDEIRAALRDGRDCTVDILNYRKDGTPFWNNLAISPVRDASGEVTHFVGVQTDVTERRRLEAQYMQAQRMEAFGQLAGGVAHDFNNLLTVLIYGCDTLLETTPPEDPRRESIEDIALAGERAANLTAQLLAFSRKQVIAPKVLDLNEAVRSTEHLLRPVVGEDVHLLVLTTPDPQLVKADASQLAQMLVNLSLNARQAMPDGGRLTVGVDGLELRRRRGQIPAGSWVRLTVSDTGTGMTEEVKRRIFEPFFTTRGLDQGSGLGLSVVEGIVSQSHGHIEVDSQPGRGSTFRIYLPRVEQASPTSVAGGAPGGTETILVVEDDDKVRQLSCGALQGLGYRVLEASGTEEALEIAARTDALDLLVTDVVMPGPGGRVLAERLAGMRPGIRILFTSGYPDDEVLQRGIFHNEVNFLQKPYSPSSLAHKVREVLAK